VNLKLVTNNNIMMILKG